MEIVFDKTQEEKLADFIRELGYLEAQRHNKQVELAREFPFISLDEVISRRAEIFELSKDVEGKKKQIKAFKKSMKKV